MGELPLVAEGSLRPSQNTGRTTPDVPPRPSDAHEDPALHDADRRGLREFSNSEGCGVPELVQSI
jgi:hypothetical protein